MTICLIRLPFNESQSIIYPPLGLVTLASYFRNADSEVGIDDLQVNNGLTYGGELYAFSVFTSQLSAVEKRIKDMKDFGYSSKSKFVVGGPGVTSNLEFAEKMVPSADLLFAGDGEYFASNPKEYLSSKVADCRSKPFNIENKRFPAWNVINYKPYLKTTGLGVETSRGCPFNCIMCTAHMIHGKSWQGRSPADVVAELKYLNHKYGCDRFYFADDNATVSPSRWKTLMQQIVDAKLNLKLSVPEGIQAHHLDYETLRLMREAGLTHFTVGAESGVQRVLDDVICKGGLTVEKIEEVIVTAKQLGMKPSCFFVIGFPNETLMEAKATVDFAEHLRHLGAESCSVRNVIPMPETRLFNTAKAKGYLTVPEDRLFDFKFIHVGRHLLKTPDWNPEQIEALVAQAKIQEGKHYMLSHPAVFVKHPRASLRWVWRQFS
jgi:radical SAM superfamily enzyme YgiQ (UPF0313 family)